MKGIFSRYDGKNRQRHHHAEALGTMPVLAEATGFFLTAKEYRFSIPVSDALHAKVKVGGEVEFESPRTKNGKVKILWY
ncbi:hypothetical protein SAMN05216509_4868 [Pseudomonas sp. B10]|uniref:hypothetical protein n=1 Tax=Pseudomonas sp. B10 TaxID=118613 RepID=UPI0009536FC5|nr:hypothetical protein [Pseudomonas sp. B10]SIR79370.1 hypothetical protein SAMN05216509_4868 [Pseudomonas sp. B10]